MKKLFRNPADLIVSAQPEPVQLDKERINFVVYCKRGSYWSLEFAEVLLYGPDDPVPPAILEKAKRYVHLGDVAIVRQRENLELYLDQEEVCI